MVIEKVPITELLDFIVDNRGKTVPTEEEGIPLVATNCIKHSSIFPTYDNIRFVSAEVYENWFRAHLEPDDILFVNKGTPGRVCLVPDPVEFCAAQDMIGFRADENKINKRYLFAALRSNYVQKTIANFHVGLVIPHFKKGDLKNLLIPRSEPETESFIGDFYYKLSNKIELNNKINAEIEAMAKLIYDYWFVQFDFPDENGKPYKSSGGKMVYNEELKREIPEGWEMKRIDELLNTDLGGTPSTKVKEYWGEEFPWLNSGEIANFPIIDSELKVTESGIINSATTLMPKGTCVLSITRHLRPSILGVDSCANQSVVGLFESELMRASYIYPYLVNEIPRLMSLRTGAQQPHINKGIVDESLMLVPEEDILENYYSSIDSMYEKIINNAFQNKELAELRDWLLPMLMNGQVTVN